MSRWVSVVRALVWKEWSLEWRGRELIVLLICNSLLMSVLVGAGVSSAVIDQMTTTKLFPMLLWLIHLFSTTASTMRANEPELEARGFEGVLLAGATGAQMYIAKVISTWLLLALAFVLSSFVLALVLNQDLLPSFAQSVAIGAGVSGALASLLVLLVAVASTSRMRGVLLPIITLPLCFPLFFAGVEMTTELLLRGAVDLSSPWPSIVLCANVLYFVLGVNLFEYVVRE